MNKSGLMNRRGVTADILYKILWWVVIIGFVIIMFVTYDKWKDYIITMARSVFRRLII